MAELKHLDRVLLERLLGMSSGLVLDFSDRTYASFFRDHGIDIDDRRFHTYGMSKAKRMRAFWEMESDVQVGVVLDALFKYIDTVKPKGGGGPVEESHRSITRRLLGITSAGSSAATTEREFLDLEFGKLNLSALALAPGIEEVINQRISEIKQCLLSNIPLAAVFHSGSALEGLLLDAAIKNPQDFNSAKSAPKREDKVLQFHEWTLSSFIDVAYECVLIGLDVKKYSHVLRDFRNYIHPFQQASSGFRPDVHTARISWQVLRAAIADLTGARRR